MIFNWDFEMILYIFQNCTYFDKKNLREIYEDTQKLEQGVPWKFG